MIFNCFSQIGKQATARQRPRNGGTQPTSGRRRGLEGTGGGGLEEDRGWGGGGCRGGEWEGAGNEKRGEGVRKT